MGKHSNTPLKGKKRKADQDGHESSYDRAAEEQISQESGYKGSSKRSRQGDAELDTSKPSAVFEPQKGRDWTVSIALPGSFIANTRDITQKNELAGRIARAAAVFCVDEVIVFDDAPSTIPPQLLNQKTKHKTKQEVLNMVQPHEEPFDNPDQFLFHVLSYLECPGHLRKHLFAHHDNLRKAGLLPTLDMPHHMRADEWCQYREGATLDPAYYKGSKNKNNQLGEVTFIDCGLSAPVQVPYAIDPGVRVTVKFANAEPPRGWPYLTADQIANLEVEPTTPNVPREEAGYYWGFSVRKADCLSSVYTETPYDADEGYDFSLGTSERGVPLSSIFPDSSTIDTSASAETPDGKLPKTFKHLLLVFGGVTGLEPAVAQDAVLKQRGLTKETASGVFDLWVNLVPGQGSRTIRTEEAVWLGLMGTREYVASRS